MPAKRMALHGMLNAGFQKITLSGTSVHSLNSTVQTADVLDISVETQDARYRADGTSPAATTGVLMQADTLYRLEGYNGTSNLKFTGAVAGSVINVQGWKFES